MIDVTVREARGQADLDAIKTILGRAHAKFEMPHSVADTLIFLGIGFQSVDTILLIAEVGEKICGYCWMEVLPMLNELLVHQVYLDPGYCPGPIASAIERTARERECAYIGGLSYRKGGAKLFRRYGYAPMAVLVRKRVVHA